MSHHDKNEKNEGSAKFRINSSVLEINFVLSKKEFKLK